MYCPNCNKEYEGKFCPECGTRLIEKPSVGGLIVDGSGNAIDMHTTNQTITHDNSVRHDSHNVHNEDKSVHNINNVSTTNVTNVAAQKTDMELLQEKKSLYLNECKRACEDNVLEPSEVIALEEYRIKIGLDKATADSILESVRVMTERNDRKTSLNPIAKKKLKILTDNLQKNEVKALMDQIDGFEALVNKYEHDELSRKYFLVLAALKPEKCISLKENSKVDSYWKSFWSYLAYIKVGKTAEAESVLVSLDRFADYPEDNITVLAVAGALMNGSSAEAKEYLDSVAGDYTPALQRFVDSLYLLLEPEMAKEMSADANTCAFYLANLFEGEEKKKNVHEKEKGACKESGNETTEKPSDDMENVIEKSLSDGKNVLVIVNDEENAEGVVGEIVDNTDLDVLSAYACNPNDLCLKDSVTGEQIPPMWASDAIEDSDTTFVLHLEHIQECTSAQLSVWKTFIQEHKICGEYIGNVVVCAEYVVYPDEPNPNTSLESLQFFDTIIRDGKCIKNGQSSRVSQNASQKVERKVAKTSYTIKPVTKSELRTFIATRVLHDGPNCDLNDIDVSGITNMSKLFEGSDFDGDISAWDVSNVTNMKGMFSFSKYTGKHGDISAWDVSNVTDMSEMFNEAEYDGDLSSWDVSEVRNMNMMFAGSNYSGKNGDISGWDVGNVTDMTDMFEFSLFDGDTSMW